MYEFDRSFRWESSPKKLRMVPSISFVSRLAAVQDDLQIAEEEFGGFVLLVLLRTDLAFC